MTILFSIKTHSPIINFVSGDDDASDNEVELEPRLFQSLQKINSGRQAQVCFTPEIFVFKSSENSAVQDEASYSLLQGHILS